MILKRNMQFQTLIVNNTVYTNTFINKLDFWIYRWIKSLHIIGQTAILGLSILCVTSLNAAPTLHEEALSSDQTLQLIDKVHNEAYRSLRGIMSEGEKQELKASQINWINSLNQALANTAANDRKQVVHLWTTDRTAKLQAAYTARIGPATQIPKNIKEVVYELIDSESNLREGPGINFAIIRRPQRGEVCKALAESNRWIKLQFADGSIGWIHQQNLRLSNTPFVYKASGVIPQDTHSPFIPRDVPEPISKPLPEPVPAPTPARDYAKEAYEEENQRAKALCSEIATHWKMEDTNVEDFPEGLTKALTDRLEQLVPWDKINSSGSSAQGRHANLKLAYTVHNHLLVKPNNYKVMSDLLEQGQSLKVEEVPWVASFKRILENRRTKALSLQKEAIRLMKQNDPQAAELRLQLAAKEYPSDSLSKYATSLAFYNKLIQDKALRAVDGDWKKPSLPNKDLISKAAEQAAQLRTFDGTEVEPTLFSLTDGLEAAGILEKFASDYEAAGNMDKPHPIYALQIMRKSEKYSKLQTNTSEFSKPFLERLKSLDALIGPKAKEYENLIEQAKILEKNQKFLDAATTYRYALAIEYSKELEKTIHACEANTSGL